MQLRIAEHAHVVNRRAERAQRKRRDRAVAAKLGRLRNDFKVGALSGSRGDFRAEAFHGVERIIFGRRLALFDDMKNLVHEAVKPKETLKLKELGARADETFGGLTRKTGIRDHFGFLTEKDWRDKLRELTSIPTFVSSILRTE